MGVLWSRYDEGGNRVYKGYTHDGVTDKTWYVRDAAGNVLAVYGNENGGSEVYWKEQHLYGSSRLGIWEPGVVLGSAVDTVWGKLGLKRYELVNHLGNVLATVSDKAVSEGGSYVAEVLSAGDYYPFGMGMMDRKYELGSYRYGFNGQEKSKEINRNENSYTAEFWEYDGRIGRRWNLDPKPRTGFSSYSTLENNPTNKVDPDGDYVFGLFGSTSEQRHAARDVAERTGGEVRNLLRRDIHVNYTTTGRAADGIMEAVNKNLYFREDGRPDFNSVMLNKFNDDEVGKGLPTARGISYVPVESLLLPASLPFQATTTFGRLALFTAEVFNPLGGLGKRSFGTINNKFGSGFIIHSIDGYNVRRMSLVRYIQQGEKIENILEEIQLKTMNYHVEYAVVRLSSGEKAIVSGGKYGIFIPEGSIMTLFGHTHPIKTGASKGDLNALIELNQSKQYIYELCNKTPIILKK